MLKAEDIINNLIEEKEYDERLVPFIKSFFLYNANQFGWDEKTIQTKIALLNQRLKGIEFVNLKDKLALTDFDFGDILINKNLLNKQLSSKGLKQIASEIFERLEIATKSTNDELVKYYEKGQLYPIEALKYSTNQEDKESIIEIISHAFNIKPKEIYNINTVWKDKIENMDSSNRAEKDFLEDSQSTMLPNVANAVSQIMNAKTDNEKANAYLDLYAISLLTLNYRLDNEQENNGIIKKQYELINEKFTKIAEKYIITSDRLKQRVVGNDWMIDIEKNNRQIKELLKSIESQDISNLMIDDFKKKISEYTMPTIFQGQTLEENYLEQQVNQILPNYEEKFRPIIQEYFRRSARIYDWTKEEFDKKIRNYQLNVKRINFIKKLQTDDGNIIAYWTAGHIDMQDDLALVNTKTVLSTSFHEQEHATDNTTRNGKVTSNGLANKYFDINEYITEIGAVHLMGEKSYDDKFCFTHSMEGYDEFKFAGSMMSAALGISEFELAKLKDQGEDAFNKTLEEKFEYIDIQNVMLEFNDILNKIKKAPSMINMRELSEEYAQMYNLANRVISARVEHEGKDVIPNDVRLFEIKSRYEMTKIAINMNLAKRKLNLKNRYISSIIKDDTILQKYSKVKRKDKNDYLSLVEELYPEKNISFDNKKILKHIDRYFKYPIKGKIMNLFNRKKFPKLEAPAENLINNSETIKQKNFQRRLQKGVKQPAVTSNNQERSEQIMEDKSIGE